MNRPIVQAVILVLAALVLAVFSNAMASRQRKVLLVGWYPNATKTSAQPSAVSSQAALAPAPVPAPAPSPATTTTIAPPTTTTTTQAPAVPAPVAQPVKPT